MTRSRKPSNNNGMSTVNLSGLGDPFVWVQEFDEEALRSFYQSFMELEQDPLVGVIPIVVSSYGGMLSTLVGMRDIMHSSTKPVATIGLGKAMSCGAALLAAGSKGLRFASPFTSIMIHEISAGVGGKNSDIQSDALNLARDNKTFFKNLAADMGVSQKQLEKILHDRRNTDWFLTAKEAQAVGIIDHVEVPRIVQMPPQFNLVTFSNKTPKKGK